MSPGGHSVTFCFDRMLPDAEVRERFSELFSAAVVHQDPGNASPATLTLYSVVRNTD